MADKKIAIVSVSKDGQYIFTDEDIAKANEALGSGFTFIKFDNKNNMKLTEIYNEYLDKYRKEGGYDYVMFIHADVRFDIPGLVDKLDRTSGKYDIVGLAGCKEFDTYASPLNWFTGSNFKPYSRYGYVKHSANGNKAEFYSSHSPMVEDTEVAAIDGLCIIFTKSALESDIKFDPKFAFDQYDTDLSLECVVSRKMHLGVIVEKSLVHNSVGPSIMSKRFLSGEIELRKKWLLQFPKTLVQRMGLTNG
jgi:hypothetical protein